MSESSIFLANYALPLPLYAFGNPDSVARYVSDVGADGIALLPTYTRLTRRLVTNPDTSLRIGVVRQTYRGEKSPFEALSYLWKPGFRVVERPAKVGVALYTVAQMPHKDASLPSVSSLVDYASPRPDVMVEVTEQSLRMTNKMRTIYGDTHHRVVQLTAENLSLLENETGSALRTMDLHGITGLSYHSSSSPAPEDIPQELVPYISYAELNGTRPDLPHARDNRGDVRRLAQGYDVPGTLVLQELRRRGAPLNTLVYSISWFEAQKHDTATIINKLRRI